MSRLLRTGSVARVASALRSVACRGNGGSAKETPKNRSARLLATTVAAAIVVAPSVASAEYICPPKVVPGGGSSSTGPAIVGCVAGSAFGLIVAALMKKNGELTLQQAQTIAFSCGLGFFLVANELKKK
jgi:hypothetical protein